jgi:hypothetical protein
MKYLFALLTLLLLVSCSQKGETSIIFSGNETNLPPELKGMTVYNVAYG